MTYRKYGLITLLSCVLILGSTLVATDSPLAGRVLTRIEAHRLIDHVGEATLELHAIEGRAEETRVIFSRVGDPVPLEPIFIKKCSQLQCAQDLSTALWSRDAQYEIADHIFDTFDKCGLPPIAIPKINLPWFKARSYDQRPIGRIFDLRATVFLDTVQIDDDISGFQETADACVRTIIRAPTENPGWALVTDNVGFDFIAQPLLSGLPRPSVRPVLERGPYIPTSGSGTTIKKYGRTVNYELIIDRDQTIRSLLTTTEHPALAGNDIRVALKQPLADWLKVVEPDRKTADLSFKSSQVQDVAGSEGMGRMFVEITDHATSEMAIVTALFELETVGQEAWQPLGFEFVAEFGRESAFDAPPMRFDLEELPNE